MIEHIVAALEHEGFASLIYFKSARSAGWPSTAKALGQFIALIKLKDN
jgi:hypothetical protein